MPDEFKHLGGYATYESAVKRGREIEIRNEAKYLWTVTILPNGRFAILIVLKDLSIV